MKRIAKWIAPAITAALMAGSAAAGEMERIPTRPDVRVALFWEAAPDARGTVLLFPGGAGGFGRLQDGKPSSNNFIVRSHPHFLAHGYNVAIFGRPSDLPEGYDIRRRNGRTSDDHLADLRAVVAHIKARSPAPLWLVGFSTGTVSATFGAINLNGPTLAGVVLTGSITTDQVYGAVPRQRIEAIRIPVLAVHHARDACPSCEPREIERAMPRFTAAPVRKAMILDGGDGPSGGVCGPVHWHGFIGMEKAAIDAIAGWMANPVP